MILKKYKDVYRSCDAISGVMVLKVCPLPADIVMLGADGVNKIWRDAKLRAAGMKRARPLVEAAKHSVGSTESPEAAKYEMELLLGDYEVYTKRLGRLFAYAPKTADGHYPCEAVCQIIEEYGDESLLSEYRCELFNKREIFSPSAGRAEKDIAEGYKDNAEFLSIKYPKTADVFFKMSQSYVYDSDLERRRAENGYF